MASERAVMAVIRASRPSFRNAADRLAFAVHAAFLVAGYSLIATGRAALSENPPTDGEEVGIDGWNEVEEAYGFVYLNMEKGSESVVLVKCLQLGNVLAIDVMDLNQPQKEPLDLAIKIDDHTSDVAGRPHNYIEFYKNFQGLLNSLNSGFLDKLEVKQGSFSSTKRVEQDGQNVIGEPLIGFPGQQDPYASGLIYPPIPGYGFDDFFPVPGCCLYPESRPFMGGSTFMDPNDPRLFDDEHLPFWDATPPCLFSPGACFDPYGPPGVLGFEPDPVVRQPRGPGGGHFHNLDFM